MREILFKAKDINTGEWVEGFVFSTLYDGCEITCIGTEPLQANDYSEILNSCYVQVDPATVSQFTGLTGRWEGDRCFFPTKNGANGYIKFGEYYQTDGTKHVGFYVKWDGDTMNEKLLRPDLPYWTSNKEVSWHGNIHDAPTTQG